MGAGIFLTYAAGLLIIYFFGRLFVIPLKILAKLLINGIAGGVVLLILSKILVNFGLFLPVNEITAMIAGLLGIPGIVASIVFFNVFSL